MPQNAVPWSSTQREIDVEHFLLRHGPTKDLGDNATAKDFIKQFYFMAILKTSADTNAGQSQRLTHCIKIYVVTI